MSGVLAQGRPDDDVVPERQLHYPSSSRGHIGGEQADLGALARSVNSGKSYGHDRSLHAIFSSCYRSASSLAVYLAPGGLLGLAMERAITVPIAAPAPTRTPTLIRKDRTWCCLPGAIAIPAGLEAPVPRMLAASAAAVPTGFCSRVV